jgi:hypothetical protein
MSLLHAGNTVMGKCISMMAWECDSDVCHLMPSNIMRCQTEANLVRRTI